MNKNSIPRAIFSESQARFTVVDMGSGKIALHNAKYNRDLHSSKLKEDTT
jgi:hypothetical protein